MTIRIAVFGALGRMGTTVCETVTADPELELVAPVNSAAHPGVEVCGVPVSASPQGILGAGAQVMVDFTRPDTVMPNIRFCVENGVHCVIGTSGFTPEKLDEVRALIAGGTANVFIAPNFLIGVVLMMSFARQAAPYMASCEIVELHHNQKVDAPSGTGEATARMVAAAWRERGRPEGGAPRDDEFETVKGARGASVDGVHVHSVRMRGLVAHQEVMFGSPGELLTIRHDSLDTAAYMPGVLLAVRQVAARPGLTVGLEQLLGIG